MSIIESMDFKFNDNKLNDEIQKYRKKHNEKYPYLFMNSKTLKVIQSYYSVYLSDNIFPMATKSAKTLAARYIGCKVYINEDLEFGEVELR